MIPAAESSKKINISVGAVAWIAFMAFSVGTFWTTLTDLKEVTDKEIEGLRADWERDRKLQNERLLRIEELIRELESKYHEEP